MIIYSYMKNETVVGRLKGIDSQAAIRPCSASSSQP